MAFCTGIGGLTWPGARVMTDLGQLRRQVRERHPVDPAAALGRIRGRILPRSGGKIGRVVDRLRQLVGQRSALGDILRRRRQHDLGQQHPRRAALRGQVERAAEVGLGDRDLGPELRLYQTAPGDAGGDEVAKGLLGHAALGKLGDELVGGQLGARGELGHPGGHIFGLRHQPGLRGGVELQPVLDHLLFGQLVEIAGRAQQFEKRAPLVDLVIGDRPVVHDDPRREGVLGGGRKSQAGQADPGGYQNRQSHGRSVLLIPSRARRAPPLPGCV